MEIGIDILEIDRFKDLQDDSVKLSKMFSKNEIEYFNKFKTKTNHITGFFCAKEAFSKALKTGIGKHFSLLDVEILHEESGSPFINILNKDLKLKLMDKEIKISISHSNNIATAICIII